MQIFSHQVIIEGILQWKIALLWALHFGTRVPVLSYGLYSPSSCRLCTFLHSIGIIIKIFHCMIKRVCCQSILFHIAALNLESSPPLSKMAQFVRWILKFVLQLILKYNPFTILIWFIFYMSWIYGAFTHNRPMRHFTVLMQGWRKHRIELICWLQSHLDRSPCLCVLEEILLFIPKEAFLRYSTSLSMYSCWENILSWYSMQFSQHPYITVHVLVLRKYVALVFNALLSIPVHHQPCTRVEKNILSWCPMQFSQYQYITIHVLVVRKYFSVQCIRIKVQSSCSTERQLLKLV